MGTSRCFAVCIHGFAAVPGQFQHFLTSPERKQAHQLSSPRTLAAASLLSAFLDSLLLMSRINGTSTCPACLVCGGCHRILFCAERGLIGGWAMLCLSILRGGQLAVRIGAAVDIRGQFCVSVRLWFPGACPWERNCCSHPFVELPDRVPKWPHCFAFPPAM